MRSVRCNIQNPRGKHDHTCPRIRIYHMPRWQIGLLKTGLKSNLLLWVYKGGLVHLRPGVWPLHTKRIDDEARNNLRTTCVFSFLATSLLSLYTATPLQFNNFCAKDKWNATQCITRTWVLWIPAVYGGSTGQTMIPIMNNILELSVLQAVGSGGGGTCPPATVAAPTYLQAVRIHVLSTEHRVT